MMTAAGTVQADSARAAYRNGVLIVTLQKTGDTRDKRIEAQAR